MHTLYCVLKLESFDSIIVLFFKIFVSVYRGQMIAPLGEFRFGAGVLDLKYESPYTLLSCGYDASLRLWDLRSGRW